MLQMLRRSNGEDHLTGATYMANQMRFAKARAIADAFEALALITARGDLPFELADVITDEGLTAIQNELGRIASFLESHPDVAKDPNIVRWINARIVSRPHMGLPALTATPLMIKATKPKWKIHTVKKDGAERKDHWTANWQGMKLRIQWVKEGKVYFVGFIDEEEVTRGAVKSRVEGEVETEALRRFALRKK